MASDPSIISSAPSGPVIDVIVEADGWNDASGTTNMETVCRTALGHAAVNLPALAGVAFSVTVLLTDDTAIRDLNAQYRGKDTPTNVLSFPFLDADDLDRLDQPGNAATMQNEPVHLGDIALALETVVREAKISDKPFVQHLTHLVIHGFLHLVGYDHESDDDAILMEDLERRLLAGLDIPDPYST